MKKVYKCDQTTPSILEPTIERIGIKDPFDVEATLDTPILKVRALSNVYEGAISYMLSLEVTHKLQDFWNVLRL